MPSTHDTNESPLQPVSFSILIVDDNAATCGHLQNLLAMNYPDFVLYLADSGRSGLESFKEHGQDIVVTDISMPFLDGISMAASMKGMHPEVAIIALTSFSDTNYLLRAIEVGIDYYLLKPLNCTKLYAAIDKIRDSLFSLYQRKEMETALQQYQAELRLANELLELRIDERTAELQASISELESFSYSVSHDLRAPLRHINSFSAILAQEYGDDLPPDARDYLERIRTATGRMGVLIDHLLELSRVGRAQIQLTTVNLSALAAAIIENLKASEPERRVETCIEEGLACYGYETLIRQLLENLLGNAWKFTSKKAVSSIEFGTRNVGGKQVFVIQDNGAGFDMEHRYQLFGIFQRLHDEEFEGTGIGLATAQKVVQRHGGRIWAEGEVGKGARFFFTLPPDHFQA